MSYYSEQARVHNSNQDEIDFLKGLLYSLCSGMEKHCIATDIISDPAQRSSINRFWRNAKDYDRICQEMQLERDRIERVKKAALAKLTKEEIELLKGDIIPF